MERDIERRKGIIHAARIEASRKTLAAMCEGFQAARAFDSAMEKQVSLYNSYINFSAVGGLERLLATWVNKRS